MADSNDNPQSSREAEPGTTPTSTENQPASAEETAPPAAETDTMPIFRVPGQEETPPPAPEDGNDESDLIENDDAETSYDREELVQTTKIDPEALERESNARLEKLRNAEWLHDSKYSPNIVVSTGHDWELDWHPAAPFLEKTNGIQSDSTREASGGEQVESVPGDEVTGAVDELLEENGEQPTTRSDLASEDHWVAQAFDDTYAKILGEDWDLRVQRDVNFIVESLSLDPEERILDLACGVGGHALSLADRGYEVIGLDQSMPLLRKALHKAKQNSSSVKFVHGDMRALEFDSIFDACTLWGTSLGFFDERTDVQILDGVSTALKPGGLFLLDVLNRDYALNTLPHRYWWEGRGVIVLEEVEFEFDTSTLIGKRSISFKGNTPSTEYEYRVRLYSPHELRDRLKRAGFEILELSGEIYHRGEHLGENSPRNIFLAKNTS